MYIFKKSNETWWQKPLVIVDKVVLPAELAVLRLEKGVDEQGLWINSRGTKSGVATIEQISGKFKTVRKDLPEVISRFLSDAYQSPSLKKGCPDLVIWNVPLTRFRLVEVKCPLWDRPSKEQDKFMEYSRSQGINAEIIEWVFEDDAGAT